MNDRKKVKVCPLRVTSNSMACMGSSCEWWNKGLRCCAITATTMKETEERKKDNTRYDYACEIDGEVIVRIFNKKSYEFRKLSDVFEEKYQKGYTEGYANGFIAKNY